MSAIIRSAEHLAELDVRYAAFAKHILGLARQYQSRAVLRFLEQHVQRMNSST